MHICLRLPPPLPIHGDRPTSVHMKIFCEPSGGLIRRSIAATIRLFRPSGIKNSEQRRINSCSSSQQVARTADTLMTANPDVHRGTVSKFTFEHEAVVGRNRHCRVARTCLSSAHGREAARRGLWYPPQGLNAKGQDCKPQQD